MMYSITKLAKKAGLPRRTVQYWHDRKVIKPINHSPVVYDNDELALVRILAALTQPAPEVSWVKELAGIIRLCMMGDESVPAGVAAAFDAARRGEPAWFGISPALMSDGQSLWNWTFGATIEGQVGSGLRGLLKAHPNLGVYIMDLQYCFNLKVEVGAIMLEDSS